MKKNCSKCNFEMVEAKLDSFPVRIYKAGEKPNANTMSDIKPYVCTSCGFIELYATEPKKFN